MCSRLLEKYPLMWRGEFMIKTFRSMVRLNYILGNQRVATGALSMPSIRVAKRLRLENMPELPLELPEDSCCVLTALPYGQNEEEVARRTKALSEGMVNYLRRKRAVGISVAPGEEYVVKVCIPSEMTASFLARIAPDWYHTICDKVHLLIVVVKLNTKK